jgi:arylsulfatase A-like enzyme
MGQSERTGRQQVAEPGFRDLLLLALWMGGLTGILEGAGFYGARADLWIGRDVFGSTADASILYLSPLFTLLVYGGVALLLQLLFLAVRVTAVLRVRLAFGVFSFLTFFDWLWLTERLRSYTAVILALGLACAAERWFRRQWQRVLELSPRLFAAAAFYVCLVAGVVSFMTWRQERTVQAALPAPPSGAPNIVLIILDTVRADHLSVYGYGRKTTPHLERLAAEGILFDNAVAPSSWTFPSHVSLLTGRYPREHGAVLNAYDRRYATVASSFDELGYLTGGFSGNMDWFAAGRGMTQGFLHFEDWFWSLSGRFAQTGYGKLVSSWISAATSNGLVLGYKRAGDVNRTALRWLDASPKRPFFLVLNYYDANAGGERPPAAFRGMFSSTPLPPPAGSAGEFAPSEIDRVRSNEYDGALAYMDSCVGELLEGLRQRRLADNLVVVVTSDHGDLHGEHGLHGHRMALYWELLHVPLIIWGLPGQPAGLHVARPVSLVSLPNTLLDIAGGKQTERFPAPSMSQLWTGRGEDSAWPFPIAELAQMKFPGLEDMPNYSGSLSAIVTPRWLLIEHSVHGPALYDWRKDPENLHDLVTSMQGKPVASRLLSCVQEQTPVRGETNCGKAEGLASAPSDGANSTGSVP